MPSAILHCFFIISERPSAMISGSSIMSSSAATFFVFSSRQWECRRQTFVQTELNSKFSHFSISFYFGWFRWWVLLIIFFTAQIYRELYLKQPPLLFRFHKDLVEIRIFFAFNDIFAHSPHSWCPIYLACDSSYPDLPEYWNELPQPDKFKLMYVNFVVWSYLYSYAPLFILWFWSPY